MNFTAPYTLIRAPNFALHFHPDHLADLRRSGLIDETIRQAGVYTLRPKGFALFFPARRGVPQNLETALCFPYQDKEFARIKLFPALGKMKYVQPPGSGARLYIPFPVLRDGNIVVAEGEKKTLAAHQAGLNAVGIGGLWNWLQSGQPIDDLNLIEWDGHDVTIIPDSDVWKRVGLVRAVYALGGEIKARGATVYVAEIPQSNGAKVGLDDFLVAGGDIEGLDVFGLSHRIFKSCQFWHSRWKFQKIVRENTTKQVAACAQPQLM
jgi:hypothetical protein